MNNVEKRRYQLLDHTADLKVEIYGKDLQELFVNAAFMIFDVMVDLDKVAEQKFENVEIQSVDLPELFLDWLRELLFRFSVQGFIPRRVEIQMLDTDQVQLKALLFGETYDYERHGLKVEIKTPTYHQYVLEKQSDGYRATVVFDV
jgi:SHS2 domain-containing protein|uniref:Archease n=1 Tax=candidate division WOR-3 bacterium TaxID=2052148 RepID=A0A7V3UZY1_UNCW3